MECTEVIIGEQKISTVKNFKKMSFENRILELRTGANSWNILDYNYGKWKICTCCDTTITMILIFKMFINLIMYIGIFCIAQFQMA